MIDVRSLSAALFLALVTSSAHAQMREIDPAELRDSVRSGQVVSLTDILSRLQAQTGGELVDVRVFDDGNIFYRIVIKREDGQLVAAIVDARAGRLLSGQSASAKSVIAAAGTPRGGPGQGGKPASTGRSSSQGDSRGGGNGNGGGNGGGNSRR